MKLILTINLFLALLGYGQELEQYTNSSNPDFLLPADFRSADAMRRDMLVVTNEGVRSINPLYDTNEICRVWTIGGETKITEFLGHTNYFGGQFSFGQELKGHVISQAQAMATLVSDTMSNQFNAATSNMVQGLSVFTNIPPLRLNTNGLGFFGTNVIAGRVGSGTNSTAYDVSAVMGGHFHNWHNKIAGWAQIGSTWILRILVGLFFGWSAYDMITRFMSTKPGDHNLQGSTYATFSAAWLSLSVFWLIMLIFFGTVLVMHMTAFGAYYGYTAVDWATFWGPIASDIITGPTSVTILTPVGQAISGFTGEHVTGSVGNSVRLVWTWFTMWFPVGEALASAITVATFYLLRQVFYNSACAVAGIVAGAL